MNQYLLIILLRKRWYLFLFFFVSAVFIILKLPTQEPYWEWKGIIHCNSKYYNRTISMVEKWNISYFSGENPDITNSANLLSLRIDPQRTEDRFSFEITATAKDTQSLSKLILQIHQKILNDDYFKDNIFERKKKLKNVIAKFGETDTSNLKISDIIFIELIRNELANLELHFYITFPYASESDHIIPNNNKKNVFILSIAVFCAFILSYFSINWQNATIEKR